MAMNKVQFQRGLSMLEFVDLYGTQARCEDVVRRWRWPQGFVCPACTRTEHSEFQALAPGQGGWSSRFEPASAGTEGATGGGA